MSDDTEMDTTHEPAAPAPKKRPAYKVVNFIDGHQLNKDLTFSLVDLSNAQMEQASLFIHYGMLAAKASRQVNELKNVMEQAHSRIDRMLRDKAAVAGEKSTEPQLERAINAHPTIITIKRAINEARQVEDIAKYAVEAFRQRRDMLIQQGATEREERRGEVRTMQRPDAGDQGRGILALAAATGKINQH